MTAEQPRLNVLPNVLSLCLLRITQGIRGSPEPQISISGKSGCLRFTDAMFRSRVYFFYNNSPQNVCQSETKDRTDIPQWLVSLTYIWLSFSCIHATLYIFLFCFKFVSIVLKIPEGFSFSVNPQSFILGLTRRFA